MRSSDALQNVIYGDLDTARNWISHAMACADRHTGPSTTSISLVLPAVRFGLMNDLEQPTALTSPSTLASVRHLELDLDSIEHIVANDLSGRFVLAMLERLPNLIYASLSYCELPKTPLLPLLQLKHLELGLQSLDSFDGMPMGALLPLLETASIKSFHRYPGIRLASELNLLGCRHLRRLVLKEVFVCRILKPTQCRLRLDMLQLGLCDFDTTEMAPALAQAHEILLLAQELCLSHSPVAHSCLPALEVLRCDWGEMYDETDDGGDGREVTDVLNHCLRHTKNLPALNSIFCSNHDRDFTLPMEVRIPAHLAGVKELVIATARPLHLLFDSASNAGEMLNGFHAVGREVKMNDPGPFLDALFERRLIMSSAEAGQEHKNAPSQCAYMRKILTDPELSYDEAIRAVNARLHEWGERHWSCGQCGACLKCLRDEDGMDSTW